MPAGIRTLDAILKLRKRKLSKLDRPPMKPMRTIFPKLIRRVVRRHGYRAVWHYTSESELEAQTQSEANQGPRTCPSGGES